MAKKDRNKVENTAGPDIPGNGEAVIKGDTKVKLDSHIKFDRLDLMILLIIIVISLGLRIYGLDYPKAVYFDEVHYVPAANDFLKDGAVDRNDIHPPLAKMIIAFFIKIYGDYPLGWRAGSVVFGLLMIVCVYLLALAMFKNRFAPIMASSLLAIDFLHIVQSRIATLDIYIAAFILFGYYFIYMYYDQPPVLSKENERVRPVKYLILSAVFLGCAVAVKISAIAGVGGAFLYALFMHIRENRKHLLKSAGYMIQMIALFTAVLLGVFVLSHVPVFVRMAGQLKKQYAEDPQRAKQKPYISELMSQYKDRITYKRTFKFHYTEKFTHPYLSQMWQWPIVHRPIWYEWTKDPVTGMLHGIVAIGSLLFWWSFIPVLLDMIYRGFKDKDNRVVFILCGYLPLYLFWLSSFSSYQGWHFKGGFFYYMMPCVPFMALGLTETLNDLRDNKIGVTSIVIYCVGLVAFLGFFYPILTGIPIPQHYFDYLMKLNIFKNWI
ncbi:MAG: phospholipid carrier-dependent glycosyltransferase [Firmicutes bacterium]|nr:phospholipid carrier-dependent glycosyltransferase [Bacillota bacterium]